ncbi:MAG: threonylcarbamoyl-AMP synthase [Clostridiales bacterium]|nr:threonylcarbamoyl-AMP synthase [Clostridiales bacterium]MCF8022541.1 threonylcarbamoyl-AMP synthase [Clostridiales bacterium]
MTAKQRNTVYQHVSVAGPEPEIIGRAGPVLREGGLVAFPTETVYGLGANALDAGAVGEIFTAKNRPADNPLIVHLERKEQVYNVALKINRTAEKLMSAFCPGPLTLVLPGRSNLPVEVTAGLNTVAVRIPDHPVALALFREAGVPVAAPSANLSGRPSPTTGEHVLEDLKGKVDMILDSGPVGVGVESTVVDVTGDIPLILRPGGVTPRQIEETVGSVELAPGAAGNYECAGGKPLSPGLKHKHYAPSVPMFLVEGITENAVKVIMKFICEYKEKGKDVGVLSPEESAHRYSNAKVVEYGSKKDPASMAVGLYSALREIDSLGVDIILAEGIGSEEIELAVMDRLRRAADKVIKI